MILAAGRGERMRPLTDVTPKPLIPVAGKSTLDRAMARLGEHGVSDVVINVHHLGKQIAAHLKGRARIVEEAALLQTGGSVKNALPLLGDGPFFVLNGDGLWQDGRIPMLARMEAAWDPGRMDALLLLHALDKTIGREPGDRGDYFLDADGRARHRGSAAAAPFFRQCVDLRPGLFRDSPDEPFRCSGCGTGEAARRLTVSTMTASGSTSARCRRARCRASCDERCLTIGIDRRFVELARSLSPSTAAINGARRY
jgi:MurNAc alpha-1-phosphate uridylyltransferase